MQGEMVFHTIQAIENVHLQRLTSKFTPEIMGILATPLRNKALLRVY